MRKQICAGSLAVMASLAALGGAPEIDLEYYSPLQGLYGSSLKKATYELIGSANDSYVYLSYGSGNRKTWWGSISPTGSTTTRSSTATATMCAISAPKATRSGA